MPSMFGPACHRSPMTLILAVVVMVLVLLAPAHATATVPMRGTAMVGHGHAQVISVVTAHSNHHGGVHDHSHDTLNQAVDGSTTTVDPERRYLSMRVFGSPLHLNATPEHPPKS